MAEHPKVLVTGAGGQVGLALAEKMPHATFLTRQELDVTDRSAVLEGLAGADVIVHLAALTDVDRCEAEPSESYRVNRDGTRNVADAAAGNGSALIFLSTDYVFDGTGRDEYLETDPTSPLNHYGHSKLEAEGFVAELARGLTIRTSWVFGRGRNFVAKMRDLLSEEREVSVVDDQTGRPTYAADLATALRHLVENPATGIINVTGSGPAVSWAGFAETIASAINSPGRVRRVSTQGYAAIAGRPLAPRPGNSVLALSKARDAGVPLRDWREGLRDHLGPAR